MNKAIKIIGISITAIILLFIIAIIGVVSFINPNDYKATISQKVYQTTGRKLNIGGEIAWSIFPWIGIKINQVRLDNPRNFLPKTFLQVQQAEVQVKLLPLLIGQIEIGTLKLDKPQIHLITNKSGQSNWQNLVQTKNTKKNNDDLSQQHQTKNKQQTTDNVKKIKADLKINIADININDAKLSWENQLKQQQLAIKNLNLAGENIGLGQFFPLSTSFSVIGKNPAIDGNLKLHSKFYIAPKQQRYQFKNLTLNTRFTSPYYLPRPLQATIKANADVDLKRHHVSLTNFKADINNLKLNGDIDVKNYNSMPIGKIDIETNEFDLQQLLTSLKISYQARQPKALANTQADIELNLNHELMDLKQFKLQLADSKLSGHANYKPKAKKLTFDVKINQLNIDNLLPITHSQQHLKKSNTQITNKHTNVSTEKSRENKSTSIQNLIDYQAHGVMSIDKLQLANIPVSHIKLVLNAKSGIIKFAPLSANVFGGKVSGNSQVDINYPNPKYNISATANNLQLGQFVGDNAGNSNPIVQLVKLFVGGMKVRGSLNMNTQIQTQGLQNQQLMQNLNGNGQFNLKNGSIQASAIISALDTIQHFLLRNGKGRMSGNNIKIADVSGSYTIRNGVITNRDLQISTTAFNASGSGTINLASNKINYTLIIDTQSLINKGVAKALSDILGKTIPIQITGTINKPSINPISGTIRNALIKNQAERVLGGAAKGLDKGVDKVKQIFGF